MRYQSKEFITRFMEHVKKVGDVLEVGSRDIGGNIKDYLVPRNSYVGIDPVKGDNVDEVLNGHDLVERFGENRFDTVICLDTLEHDDKFWVTVDQMKKVLKSGGYMVLGVPSRSAPQHDYPEDCWRFMPDGFLKLFADMEDVLVETEYQPDLYLNNKIEAELYGWGRKK